MLLEGSVPFGEVEAAIEVAGHRLADSVAEVKQSNGVDFKIHRLCDIITAAAKDYLRAQSEESP